MQPQSVSTPLERSATGTLSIYELVDAAARCMASGDTESARQLYRNWISCNQGHPLLFVAHFNCSALESQLSDAAAAMISLKQAIALNADFAPAYINLGGMLERAGAPEQALQVWRTIIGRPMPINGNSVSYAATVHKQIARVLSDHHQIEAAEEAVQSCLDINPHQQDIVEQYVALRLGQCKWPVIVGRESVDRKALLRGVHPLSMSAYTDDPLLQLASAERYARLSAQGESSTPDADRRHARIDLSRRRLRVGYVSSDLRDHAIGYLMAEFFELHDKRALEIFTYYCGPASTSALTNRIKAAVEHWVDIRSLSDDEAAVKIAKDGIDILVDINGHTRDSRPGVFARRPAPVQVNWLGYPGTMGTPYHHYIIADDWIIPAGSEIYYSEKVVRLPCYQPNDRRRPVAPERPTRRDAGLPDDATVFCCFNATHKISRFTFERWMEIVKRVPSGVLWLLDASPETRKRLGEFAESKGVSSERLVFAPKQPNHQHLARYALADLALDTVPYGAHTTASDALWMGIPVLTLSGRGFASRVCGSLVRAAGLAELVVTRPEDYVERAVALGNDRAALEEYKRKLHATRDTCRLFDMETLVSRIEALYRTIARAHNKGETPRPDMTNLDAYLEVGIEHDHEECEMLPIDDYHGLYRAKLRRRHLARAMPPDQRLWTAEEIALAERFAVKQANSNAKSAKPRKSQSAVKRRRAGTR